MTNRIAICATAAGLAAAATVVMSIVVQLLGGAAWVAIFAPALVGCVLGVVILWHLHPNTRRPR